MSSLRGKHNPLRALIGAVIAGALVGVVAPAAWAGAPYENPFAGDSYMVGRTDMGVDLCLSPGDPIRAIGDGVVIGITRNWFRRQPYIWYQLSDGADAGRYVYVAEQIGHLAHVGQQVHVGQPVARYAAKGTCIETGWATSDGWTVAQASTGYAEGQVTQAGVSFARVLIGVGVQGTFELTPTRPRHRHRPKP